MKNEKLLHALGQIEEEFIQDAAPENIKEKAVSAKEGTNGKERSAKKAKASYGKVKWVALAACAALIIGLGAPRLSRVRKEDKRSFYPEGETEKVAQGDILKAIAALDDTSASVMVEEELPDWGLTLSVKDVTPTGLTLVCTQNGGNPTGEIDCGTEYSLFVREGGTWKNVPTVIENYAWDCLAYWIDKGKDTEFPISWEWLYGKLPAGTYRLTKGFMDFRGTGDYDTARYWVDFEIKE